MNMTPTDRDLEYSLYNLYVLTLLQKYCKKENMNKCAAPACGRHSCNDPPRGRPDPP